MSRVVHWMSGILFLAELMGMTHTLMFPKRAMSAVLTVYLGCCMVIVEWSTVEWSIVEWSGVKSALLAYNTL